MKYEWSEAMATGDAEIDDAHRQLIQAINRLDDAVERGTEAAEVPGILRFLETYAWRHFSHEEGCFLRHRCPLAETNQRAHAGFVARFTRMRDDIERDGITPERVAALHKELGDWLVNHILKVDTSLTPYLK
jgi:hemerythrin